MVAESDLDLWTWVSGRRVRPGLVDLGHWSQSQTWTGGPGSVVAESDLDWWTWVNGRPVRLGLVLFEGKFSQFCYRPDVLPVIQHPTNSVKTLNGKRADLPSGT